MATSILKGNEWLNRKRANYGHGQRIRQAGFRDTARNGLYKPAHSHNAPVLEPGKASVCVPCPAGDGGERPAFFTRSSLLNRSGRPSPHGTNLGVWMFCLLVVALAGCATGPGGNGTQASNWERDVEIPAPVPPIALAVPLAPEPVITPPAPSVPTNQPAETWISLSRWCKANGLAAPFL